jgi:translation initiation factor IF-2
MTEDRDFKKVVRKRSAKTGESYQAARRQVERQPAGLSAPVYALWAHPAGLVLGCRVEAGQIDRGMPVTVMAGDTVVHQGTVASLRRGKVEQDVVTSGDCGILLDPPFHGHVGVQGDAAEGGVPGVPGALGALRPVVLAPLPYLVVGSGNVRA